MSTEYEIARLAKELALVIAQRDLLQRQVERLTEGFGQVRADHPKYRRRPLAAMSDRQLREELHSRTDAAASCRRLAAHHETLAAAAAAEMESRASCGGK